MPSLFPNSNRRCYSAGETSRLRPILRWYPYALVRGSARWFAFRPRRGVRPCLASAARTRVGIARLFGAVHPAKTREESKVELESPIGETIQALRRQS